MTIEELTRSLDFKLTKEIEDEQLKQCIELIRKETQIPSIADRIENILSIDWSNRRLYEIMK